MCSPSCRSLRAHPVTIPRVFPSPPLLPLTRTPSHSFTGLELVHRCHTHAKHSFQIYPNRRAKSTLAFAGSLGEDLIEDVPTPACHVACDYAWMPRGLQPHVGPACLSHPSSGLPPAMHISVFYSHLQAARYVPGHLRRAVLPMMWSFTLCSTNAGKP